MLLCFDQIAVVRFAFWFSTALCCYHTCCHHHHVAVVVVSVVVGGVLVPVDSSFCFSFHVQDPSERDVLGRGTQCEDLINM